MMEKIATIICASFLLFVMSWGCSSGGKGWSDPLLNELLDYQEYDVVTFNIAGNMACNSCSETGTTGEMVTIEVFPKNDAMKDLAIRNFDGIGPFTISNLQYLAGEPLIIYGKLYLSLDLEGETLTTKVEVDVPDEDGEVVAVTLNF